MTRRTYEAALRVAGRLLAAGWPVLVDGTFSSAGQRAEAREVAKRLGVPFAALWCDAPDPVIADRLRRRAEDPSEVSDAGVELLPRHRAQYAAPAQEPDVIRIDTTLSAEQAARDALSRLAQG